MTTPNQYSFYETVKPPPTESLVVSYLAPLMDPLRILTRIPPQEALEDTVKKDTFIRIESAGGAGDSMTGIYTLHIILHSYAPYNSEVLAEDNLATAIAWMGNALGSTVVTLDNYEWYIIDSNVLSNMHHLTDPRLPLARYRSSIMWAVEGNVIAPISTGKTAAELRNWAKENR